MATPITPAALNQYGAETLRRVQSEQEQIHALGLNDLLPDVPQTNDQMAWKAWEQERKRGPVTEEGMLEAYRRGYERGRMSLLDDALTELGEFAPKEDDR
jgi:hypothetical protein